MTQRLQVPKFGNWEGETTIPYTVYFDRAVGGQTKGEITTPSGHNRDKLCNGSSSGEVDPDDGMEKLTELEQPNWEVPKFGDWDGVGEDPQYTVYFEKVRKGRSRGDSLYGNGPYNGNTAEDAYSPARKIPIEGKSPQHPKGKKSSVLVYEKPRQESTNRLQGSSAAFPKEHKKMAARRSPDSKHNTDRSPAGVQQCNSSSEMTIRSPRNFGNSEESRLRSNPRQNEMVIPSTTVRSSGSWDESDPQKISGKHRNNTSQTRSVTDSNSSYNKSPTQIKERNANTCCFPWRRK